MILVGNMFTGLFILLQLIFTGLADGNPTVSDAQVPNYQFDIKYFRVPVDHFSFTTNESFNMRYLINDKYWTPDSGAPIFFYTGNEGDIIMFANNTGFMWEIAPEFNALVVFAEHRYYGESMPYGNNSFQDPKHWGYLTAEQALADYVDLLTMLTETRFRSSTNNTEETNTVNGCNNVDCEFPSSSRVPIISFGGSYGGMLSAWFRMKYPGLVTGALASSAPIWQFTGITDCRVFYRIVTSVFKKEARNCPDNIRNVWSTIDKMADTADGLKWLSTSWKLCKELKSKSDVYTLKGWLNEAITDVAMVNYPYPADFLAALPGHPVRAFCRNMAQGGLKGKELLTATFNALQVWFNYTGSEKCLNSSIFGTESLGLEGWTYQSCSEMVMPICADGVDDMFEPAPWNLTEVMESCISTYNAQPRPYHIVKEYGGKNIEAASNIIFSNGLLDPWSGGGVMKNVSANTIAVILPQAAHHLDLRATHRLDPFGVVSARKYYKRIFRKWIAQFHMERNTGHHAHWIRRSEC